MKSIYIEADTLPEAFEKALVSCWERGEIIRTQYDKPEDSPSKDCTMLISIKNPAQEPRISRMLALDLISLEKYHMEVNAGVHDYYMNDFSNEHRWQYTYWSRLFAYKSPCSECNGSGWALPRNTPNGCLYNDETKVICPKCDGRGKTIINQIEKCIDLLKECEFSRRAQAITWMPEKDLGCKEPPCLQSLLFRVQDYECEKCSGGGCVNTASPQYDLSGNRMDNACFDACEECNGSGKVKKLNMNVRFRSNDLYKAFAPNTIAIFGIQEYVASKLGIKTGSLTWCSESMHIYGSYFKEIENCLKTLKTRTFEERVWKTEDCADFFLEANEELLKEEKMPEDKKELVRQRIDFLKKTFCK